MSLMELSEREARVLAGGRLKGPGVLVAVVGADDAVLRRARETIAARPAVGVVAFVSGCLAEPGRQIVVDTAVAAGEVVVTSVSESGLVDLVDGYESVIVVMVGAIRRARLDRLKAVDVFTIDGTERPVEQAERLGAVLERAAARAALSGLI